MAALPLLILRPILPFIKRIEVPFPFKISMDELPQNGFKNGNVWLYSEGEIFLLGYAMSLIIAVITPMVRAAVFKKHCGPFLFLIF